MPQPPPLPPSRHRRRWGIWLLPLTAGGFSLMALVLMAAGLLRTYSIPTDGMKPVFVRGDTVVMEGVTYLFRAPRRGEIVVFRTDGLEGVAPGEIYARRLVGKPGDTLRIANGLLYVNQQPLPMTNAAGVITYANLPFARYLATAEDSVTVPDGRYFVLGDNSARSSDSRIFGTIPAGNIRGRIILRR